eukprot:1153933-Pelagomonas_calceolata.AAC.10
MACAGMQQYYRIKDAQGCMKAHRQKGLKASCLQDLWVSPSQPAVKTSLNNKLTSEMACFQSEQPIQLSWLADTQTLNT